jgi:tetratricopeptide (TPR) repeat protein
VWIDELEYRLNTQPLEQVNLLWLEKMNNCVVRGKCPKEDMQLPRLLKAVIGYSKANAKNKSMSYAILAKYTYQVEGDRPGAVEFARKAVSIMPSNLYHRLNLVKYLIGADHLFEAKKALESVEKLDIYGNHTAEIAKLNKTLENKQYNPMSSPPELNPFPMGENVNESAVKTSK